MEKEDLDAKPPVNGMVETLAGDRFWVRSGQELQRQRLLPPKGPMLNLYTHG